jgi:hypothetical protein
MKMNNKRIKGLLLMATLCLLVGLTAQLPDAEAQTYTVTGTVYDASGNVPLAGVVVTVKDAANNPYTSPATDATGNFTVTVPGVGDYSLTDVVKAGYEWISAPPYPITLPTVSQATTDTFGAIYMRAATGPEPYVISLASGWNLISLPNQPADTTISTVLADIIAKVAIVWQFDADPNTGGWHKYQPGKPSDLGTMEAGKGYWIKTTATATLTNSGDYASKSITLLSGWNLVGFCDQTTPNIATALASVLANLSIVWQFDADPNTGGWHKYQPGKPSDLGTMGPGNGYWIKTTQGCALTYP